MSHTCTPRIAIALLAFMLPCVAVDLASARCVVNEVRSASFPELANARITVRPFSSPSDYFRSQFRLFPTHYVLLVNRQGAPPPDGVRAILAHELSHLAYYDRRPRIRILGLVRLAFPRSRAKFERVADLDAIRRGYGPGLKLYREWLYQNIPARSLPEKMRDYLSPAEIEEAVRNNGEYSSDQSRE